MFADTDWGGILLGIAGIISAVAGWWHARHKAETAKTEAKVAKSLATAAHKRLDDEKAAMRERDREQAETLRRRREGEEA